MEDADKIKRGRHRKHQRQSGTKLFQVAIELPRRPDGKRERKWFYGATNAEAQEKADTFKQMLKGGIIVDDQGLTVEQWGEIWFESYKINFAYNTRQVYENVLKNKVYPKIGQMKITDVRNVHLQNLLSSYAKSSRSAIEKIQYTLSQMFRVAVKNQIISLSPAADLDTPAGTVGSHRALEKWEIDLIVQNWRHHRAGVWVMLMLFAGLRRGEMIALKWNNVNLDAHELVVAEAAHIEKNRPVDGSTKTEAGMRTIPITPPLHDALRAERAKGIPGEYVCTMSEGEQITLTGLRRGMDGLRLVLNKAANGQKPELTPGKAIFKLTKEESKGKTKEEKEKLLSERRAAWEKVHFTPHDLRHTFATMLYDAGVDMKTAQYLLGHKDVRMTMQLYTHLSEERKNEATKAMQKFFNQWGDTAEAEGAKN